LSIGTVLTAFDSIAHCPLPVFGVSAFGTRLCFYRMHRDHELETIQPSLIPCHPERVTGTAPQERWDCELFKDEGEKRFKSMVEEIKQACTAL